MSVIDLAKERDRCRSHHPANRATSGRGAPRPTTTAWRPVVGLAALALFLSGIGGFDPVELGCIVVAVGLAIAALRCLPKAGES